MGSCGSICDNKGLQILAKNIMEISNTSLKRAFIRNELKEIVCSKGENKQRLIRRLAEEIVRGKQSGEQYPELKKYLYKVKLWISERDKNDVYGIGGFLEFKKKYFGVINISKSGTMVDTVYQELESEYPWLFPEYITHPGEQLRTIAEVAVHLRTGYIMSSESEEYDIQDISKYIRQEILSMEKSIDLRFEVGQEVYMIVKDEYRDKKVESGKIKEIALDNKGWHMHVNGRRYGLESPLMFETEYEALNQLEEMQSRKKK